MAGPFQRDRLFDVEIMAIEDHAFGSETIDMGGGHPIVAVTAEVPVVQAARFDHDDFHTIHCTCGLTSRPIACGFAPIAPRGSIAIRPRKYSYWSTNVTNETRQLQERLPK